MKFHYSTYRIQCRYSFTISRSSNDSFDVVFVYLTQDGKTGMGEASPSKRYGESFDQILAILSDSKLAEQNEIKSLEENDFLFSVEIRNKTKHNPNGRRLLCDVMDFIANFPKASY